MAVVEALRTAIRDNTSSRLRQFALLALNAAGDKDASTLDIGQQDPDPQVRRLTVIGSKTWLDDPSPLVRVESVRVGGNCEKAAEATRDPSPMVSLVAADFLGTHGCPTPSIEPLLAPSLDWRMRAHALVSLARIAPDAARLRLAEFRDDARWQVRT